MTHSSTAGLAALRAARTNASAYGNCQGDGAEPARCLQHGGYMRYASSCQTDDVLNDVRAERARQYSQYGNNDDLLDGTGQPWLPLGGGSRRFTAGEAEEHFRAIYENHEAIHGDPTWRHLLVEELAEALVETDRLKLREELIQVAAVAVSWIEKLDAQELVG